MQILHEHHFKRYYLELSYIQQQVIKSRMFQKAKSSKLLGTSSPMHDFDGPFTFSSHLRELFPSPPRERRAPPHGALLVTDYLQADPLSPLLSPCFREGQSPDVAVRTGDI